MLAAILPAPAFRPEGPAAVPNLSLCMAWIFSFSAASITPCMITSVSLSVSIRSSEGALHQSSAFWRWPYSDGGSPFSILSSSRNSGSGILGNPASALSSADAQLQSSIFKLQIWTKIQLALSYITLFKMCIYKAYHYMNQTKSVFVIWIQLEVKHMHRQNCTQYCEFCTGQVPFCLRDCYKVLPTDTKTQAQISHW